MSPVADLSFGLTYYLTYPWRQYKPVFILIDILESVLLTNGYPTLRSFYLGGRSR